MNGISGVCTKYRHFLLVLGKFENIFLPKMAVLSNELISNKEVFKKLCNSYWNILVLFEQSWIHKKCTFSFEENLFGYSSYMRVKKDFKLSF